jgi:N-alpha-acetyl-L-2,4-diaminobutyrate deacetylase
MSTAGPASLSLENPVLKLVGNESGRNVAVFVAVHGNEVCGPRAVNALLPNLDIRRGSVTFVLANPRALEQGVRFTEQNLNRLFKHDDELSDIEKLSYEYARSRELMSILDENDILLDVHSSATPDAIPFTVCEPFAYDIVKNFPTSIISSGWDLVQPGGTDYYMNKRGKTGICVESGFHDEPSSITLAKNAIISFLISQGVLDDISHEQEISTLSREFIDVYHMHVTRQNFVLATSFDDFQYIEQGTVIGTDGDETITVEEDAYIIFARNRESPSQEAFLLAKRVL